MYKQLITYLLMVSFIWANGQEKRTFIYRSEPISFLAQNNRVENEFSFPGMNVYIIIGENNNNLDSLYIKDKFRQIPITGMKDYTCFYYLTYNKFLFDSSIIDFFRGFVAYNYNRDLINRNNVHLIWLNNQQAISCDSISKLNTIVASIHAMRESKIGNCHSIVQIHLSTQDTWQYNVSAKTTVLYSVPGVLDMEEKQNKEKAIRTSGEYATWKSNMFIQVTGGTHTIGNQYRTDFDTATLVDFSKIKTLWNITAGYHFTNWFALLTNAGFIYSGKQKTVDGISWGDGGGITVNGSGYAGAMIRYGLGCRFIPYSKAKLSTYLDFMGGGVKVLAGGGKGTRTIGGGGSGSADDIVMKKANTTFYVVGAGINYRLSKEFHFTTNLQYNISSLKEPIGSVKAFTGLSVNAGIGFNFSLKKKKDE
jgi:hypothetical protein